MRGKDVIRVRVHAFDDVDFAFARPGGPVAPEGGPNAAAVRDVV